MIQAGLNPTVAGKVQTWKCCLGQLPVCRLDPALCRLAGMLAVAVWVLCCCMIHSYGAVGVVIGASLYKAILFLRIDRRGFSCSIGGLTGCNLAVGPSVNHNTP